MPVTQKSSARFFNILSTNSLPKNMAWYCGDTHQDGLFITTLCLLHLQLRQLLEAMVKMRDGTQTAVGDG